MAVKTKAKPKPKHASKSAPKQTPKLAKKAVKPAVKAGFVVYKFLTLICKNGFDYFNQSLS